MTRVALALKRILSLFEMHLDIFFRVSSFVLVILVVWIPNEMRLGIFRVKPKPRLTAMHGSWIRNDDSRKDIALHPRAIYIISVSLCKIKLPRPSTKAVSFNYPGRSSVIGTVELKLHHEQSAIKNLLLSP